MRFSIHLVVGFFHIVIIWQLTNKFEPRSISCVFMGYSSMYKGFQCLDPVSFSIYITRHAKFDDFASHSLQIPAGLLFQILCSLSFVSLLVLPCLSSHPRLLHHPQLSSPLLMWCTIFERPWTTRSTFSCYWRCITALARWYYGLITTTCFHLATFFSFYDY